MKREVTPEGGGAAHGEWGCSSLRVWGWWMLTMNYDGVEISIAGGVVEMVRDANPRPFFVSDHILNIVSSGGQRPKQ